MNFKEGLARLFSKDSRMVTPNMASLDTQRRQAAQRGREKRIFGKETIETSKNVKVVKPDITHTAAFKRMQGGKTPPPASKTPGTPKSHYVGRNVAEATPEQLKAQMKNISEAAKKGEQEKAA